MLYLLGWFVRKLGLRSVIAMSLLGIALGTLTLGLATPYGVVRGFDIALALFVALVALLIGWLLARLPFPGWLAGFITLLVGVEFILVRVGQLGRQILDFASTLLQWAWQAWRDFPRLPDTQLVINALIDLSDAIVTLAVRWFDWVRAIANGNPAFDPVAVALTWSALVWLVAAWASWATFRRQQPFAALFPALVLLATMIAYTNTHPTLLLLFVSAFLLLMSLVSYSAREQRWQSSRIDIAEDLGGDVAVSSIFLVTILVVIAAIVPSISFQTIAHATHQVIEQQTGDVVRLPDSFGIAPPPRPTTVFDTVRMPGLPRYHLIGLSPELSQRLVMTIQTDDPGAAYWRSITYDRYTGYGWATSETSIVNYSAGQRATELEANHHLVQQSIRLADNLKNLLVTTGTLVTADHDYQVAWRSLDDAFSASIDATAYRVESFVPDADPPHLRQAGNDYPDWIRARYLALPDDVPVRVLALARDLTATEATAYDRALALETFLRTLPYTLDVTAPPPSRDVVDYFLFDLKRGYCDYYASAMVVLARAAGLPARLVVGYASGNYDMETATLTIVEANAHSWAEVYFPNYGWIEFEPTGGLALPDRSPEASAHRTPSSRIKPASLPITPTRWDAIDLPALMVALIALGSLAGIVWVLGDSWRLHRLAPALTIDEIYRRMIYFTRRLNIPACAADTPNEIAERFVKRFIRFDRRIQSMLNRAQAEVCWLTDLYTRSRYSQHGPDARDRTQAIRLWRRLHRRLWLAWVGCEFERFKKRKRST